MAFRDYSTALGRIVDGTGNGDFTTIASATTAAVSGDVIFIRPGTYTADWSPKDGVTYVAFSELESPGPVKLVGKLSFSTAVAASFKGLYFETNSDFIVEITGTSNVTARFEECYFLASDTTAFSCTASAGTQTLNLYRCRGDLSTTGITWFVFTRGGFNAFFCRLDNSALATTTSSATNANIAISNGLFNSPITTAGTGSIGMSNTSMRLGGLNATCVTHGGTGSGDVEFCILESGTASAVSVGTGAVLTLVDNSLDSSNTNVVTGLGTVEYGGLVFTGSSNTMNTTTQTADIFRPGITRSEHQPAFLGVLSGDDANATGNGATYTLGSGNTLTEVFDQGSNFTTAGVFTAPYTGRYQLQSTVQVAVLTVAMTFGQIRIVTSNKTYFMGAVAIGVARTVAISADLYSLMATVLADMDVNDTATITVRVGGGVGDTATISATNTFFSGCLIC